MSGVYVIEGSGKTAELSRIKCKDEDKELQRLLEQNHDLLPGDQIRPDDPRRWLLIRREMPVQDPGTGDSRWNIDFFFVDQSGMPTFVECKRFLDTRSRREVIGQMLEYAANGHYYWSKEMVREFSAATAKQQDAELEDVIRSFEPESGDSVDDFFERIENNLREGQIRLIFFMEESPWELRSIVDFLNRQMERSEVLIVEAKQYEKDGLRIVVPTLFGYTEQARRVKKSITVTPGDQRKWNENEFFDEVKKNLRENDIQAIRRLYDFSRSRGCEIRWGAGKQTGSFSVVPSNLFSKAVFVVFTNGRFGLNFGGLLGNSIIEEFRDTLASETTNKLGLSLPGDFKKKYPSFSADEWSPKVQELISILEDLFEKYSKLRT